MILRENLGHHVGLIDASGRILAQMHRCGNMCWGEGVFRLWKHEFIRTPLNTIYESARQYHFKSRGRNEEIRYSTNRASNQLKTKGFSTFILVITFL